jgi:hypothetical protein
VKNLCLSNKNWPVILICTRLMFFATVGVSADLPDLKSVWSSIKNNCLNLMCETDPEAKARLANSLRTGF